MGVAEESGRVHDSVEEPRGTAPLGSSEEDEPSVRAAWISTLAALQRRYDDLTEIGRGGMGIVYRGLDRETGERVALKVIRSEAAPSPTAMQRFRNELRLTHKITHKHVCRTYDFMRIGDTLVLAMEYVEGENLRAKLERLGGVSLRRGLEWARQICSALREAHAQGVVHRDLKPENIFIDNNGQVKVMDFGIARSLVEVTATGDLIIGTPAYMSPEQAEGKPLDGRSDIYALGLVLYEMFAGERPFKADTPVSLVHMHVHELPTPPSTLGAMLPPRIERAILKCLEKSPAQRFQSVDELETALEEKYSGPAADPLPAPALPWIQRRDSHLLVGMMVLATVLLLNQVLSREGFLRTLFWAGVTLLLVSWFLSVLIIWKIEAVLLMRFAMAGLDLPELTRQVLVVAAGLRLAFPGICLSTLAALWNPDDPPGVRSRPARSLFLRKQQKIRHLNNTALGAIMLAVNAALTVLLVYGVLVVPFLELVNHSR
jgi:predicted Ser/Thr protein kinase